MDQLWTMRFAGRMRSSASTYMYRRTLKAQRSHLRDPVQIDEYNAHLLHDLTAYSACVQSRSYSSQKDSVIFLSASHFPPSSFKMMIMRTALRNYDSSMKRSAFLNPNTFLPSLSSFSLTAFSKAF